MTLDDSRCLRRKYAWTLPKPSCCCASWAEIWGFQERKWGKCRPRDWVLRRWGEISARSCTKIRTSNSQSDWVSRAKLNLQQKMAKFSLSDRYRTMDLILKNFWRLTRHKKVSKCPEGRHETEHGTSLLLRLKFSEVGPDDRTAASQTGNPTINIIMGSLTSTFPSIDTMLLLTQHRWET